MIAPKAAARAGARMKIGTIEGLRGLAALAVTWFHLTNSYSWDLVRWSGTYGWLGVDCFFVISGFVIPYSLYGRGYTLRQFPRFLLKRLVRLEPPYLASVALVLVLLFLGSHAPGFKGADPVYDPVQIVAHFFYLIPFTSYGWLNVVYWTLAYEFAFYIIVGLTFVVLWPRPIYWTLGLTAVAVGLMWLVTRDIDSRIILFAVGIAAMRHYVGRDPARVFWPVLAGCGLAMLAAGDVGTALVGVATAVVVVRVKIPSVPVLTWLGSISYSLYLIHVPVGGRVVNLGSRFGSGLLYEAALSLTALLVSILFAWGFSIAFEKAAMRLSQRIRLGGEPSPQDAGAAGRPTNTGP